PVQAALASAATFAVGAALPIVVAAVVPAPRITLAVPVASLLLLAALGTLSARAGGARKGRAALRVTVWGALAMALPAAVGRVLGAAVRLRPRSATSQPRTRVVRSKLTT